LALAIGPPSHLHHTSVDFNIYVEWSILMKASELKKLLAAKGCRFETHRGGSGHLTVIRGDGKTQFPVHSQKELGTGLVNKILKDLGLK
jgi:mRNA interferase HicA